MIEIKRGDTFKYNAVVTADDAPIAGGIAAWIVSAQIRRKSDQIVATLTYTLLDATACTYTLEAVGGTDTWPVEIVEMDIEYTVDGVIMSTETVEINVFKDITR